MTTTVEHAYSSRGAARELFRARDDEVLLCGPAGTGKTRACLEKLSGMCWKYPGMRALLVRKTFTTLSSTVLEEFRAGVIREFLDAGVVDFYGGSAQQPAQFRYSNGSVVLLAGMDNPTKILSSQFDLILVEEAIELTENDWELLTTRLRNGRVPYQQIIGSTNPSTPTHWLKQRCDRGVTRLLQTRHEDNPRFFDRNGRILPEGTSYLRRLDTNTGVRHARMRRGLWVSAEGMIYDGLEPATHFIDPFPVPPEWPRWWSIDWGFTNPFVCQWWAEDPDGRAYLYREILMSHRTVDVHAEQIMRIVCPGGDLVDGRYTGGEWVEPKPRAIVADHDAGDRATFTKVTGLGTKTAKKDVQVGIQAVQRRLKPAADGRPRLFLMNGSLVERDPLLDEAKKPCSTIEEMPGYIWDVGKGKQPKEQPVKEDDHGCDGMRYFVMEREQGGINRVRYV